MDDGATAQIEEILAHPTIACASSLPVADMGESMLNGHTFEAGGARAGAERPARWAAGWCGIEARFIVPGLSGGASDEDLQVRR